jgi:hypothetical protein
MYGGHYLIYGSGFCAHCGARHAAGAQLRETPRSRFRLVQLMAEMSTTFQAGGRPLVHAGAGQKFMLGLLIAGGRTYVATSGGNLANAAFVAAAGRKGYTICPARRPLVGVNRSAGGRAIPAGQYMAMQAAGASPAGDCAAPRMIQRALELGAVNPAGWEMSESYYQPNTDRRLRDDSCWVHGLSAHSCKTCENLVPLLLCPRP